MIFYIIAALLAIGTVYYWIKYCLDGGNFIETPFGWAGMFLLFTAVGGIILAVFAGAITFALVGLNSADAETKSDTHGLRALQTSDSISGQFFLGSGTIDGHRTLNYISWQEDENGVRYSKVDNAYASDSRIYEDGSGPEVEILVTRFTNAFWVPWDLQEQTKYEFHIPAGSVLEDYTITNE